MPPHQAIESTVDHDDGEFRILVDTFKTYIDRRKHVTFAEPLVSPRIKSEALYLSADEIQNCWYDTIEYKKMRSDDAPIIKMLSKGFKLKETKSLTVRGLENRTRPGGRLRKENQMKSKAAVRRELDRQIELGMQWDDIKISEVYRESFDDCLLRAHELAEEDAADVLNYMEESVMYEYENLDNLQKLPSHSCLANENYTGKEQQSFFKRFVGSFW